MILAVDTSVGTVVTLADPATGRFAEHRSDDPRAHAETIGPALAGVLERLDATPAAVGAVAAGMGPGPFTGLRIGIAAARAFAAARGLVVLPLTSHDAIALGWYLGGGSGELLVAADARRREHFWSRYTGLDAAGLPIRAEGPALSKSEALPSAVAVLIDAPVPGAALAELAARAAAVGAAPPGPAQPIYLRSPDVTLSPAKGVTG